MTTNTTPDLIREMQENVAKYGRENTTTFLMVQAINELQRLHAGLAEVRRVLVAENEREGGPITDTIWRGPSETLLDYIDNLAGGENTTPSGADALDVAMSKACIHSWDQSQFTSGDCDAVHPMFSMAFEAGYRAALSAAQEAPIDMVLHCPACGMQHIDAPSEARQPRWQDAAGNWHCAEIRVWTNPPHRSHLCHGCGHIWRPADVPTNGVQAVKTTGKSDSPIIQPAAQQGDERQAFEAALTSKPDARFWNTTDAMFWAWQARAKLSAAQAAQAQEVAPQPAAQQGIDERGAFESIFKSDCGVTFERDKNGFYKSVFVSEAWKVWQARAALTAQAQEAAPAAQGEPSDARDEGFYSGVCLALQVMTAFGDAGSSAWNELLKSAGREQVEHHAKHVDPDMWELTGFAHIERQEQANRDELEDAARRAAQQKGASK